MCWAYLLEAIECIVALIIIITKSATQLVICQYDFQQIDPNENANFKQISRSTYYLWLGMVLTSEGIRYIYNVFSYWLWPSLLQIKRSPKVSHTIITAINASSVQHAIIKIGTSTGVNPIRQQLLTQQKLKGTFFDVNKPSPNQSRYRSLNVASFDGDMNQTI